MPDQVDDCSFCTPDVEVRQEVWTNGIVRIICPNGPINLYRILNNSTE